MCYACSVVSTISRYFLTVGCSINSVKILMNSRVNLKYSVHRSLLFPSLICSPSLNAYEFCFHLYIGGGSCFSLINTPLLCREYLNFTTISKNFLYLYPSNLISKEPLDTNSLYLFSIDPYFL